MSAVALAKAELPATLSREPLRRLAPFVARFAPLARVFLRATAFAKRM